MAPATIGPEISIRLRYQGGSCDVKAIELEARGHQEVRKISWNIEGNKYIYQHDSHSSSSRLRYGFIEAPTFLF